jgi:uncharacterized protein YqeY
MELTIRERIQKDRIAAMKSGDSDRKAVLDYILGELQKSDKDLSAKGDTATAVIKAYVKSLKDFIAQHGTARPGEAAKYQKEIDILMDYLPRQLTDDEVRAEVRALLEAGVSAKGQIMAELKKRHGAALDGRRAAEIAGELAER